MPMRQQRRGLPLWPLYRGDRKFDVYRVVGVTLRRCSLNVAPRVWRQVIELREHVPEVDVTPIMRNAEDYSVARSLDAYLTDPEDLSAIVSIHARMLGRSAECPQWVDSSPAASGGKRTLAERGSQRRLAAKCPAPGVSDAVGFLPRQTRFRRGPRRASHPAFRCVWACPSTPLSSPSGSPPPGR